MSSTETTPETKPTPEKPMSKEEAIEWKFQRIAHATGIDLQTDEEKEQARKDADEAEKKQKEIEKQQAEDDEAAAEEAESADKEPEAKQLPATTQASQSSGKSK